MFAAAALASLLLLISPSLARAQAAFVTLNNGAMVPCDHPLAIAEGKGCSATTPGTITTPIPQGTPLPHGTIFHVGHTYLRPSDGQRIHIAALGQFLNAVPAFFAQCLNTSFSGCLTVNYIWPIAANSDAEGWIDQPDETPAAATR